jgi:hypothetical protein
MEFVLSSVCRSRSYLTTDNQSASLFWCQPSSGPVTNLSFSLKFLYFAAPSLTWGRVCNILLLLGLARTVPLGSKSRGTQYHIFLSKFLDSPNLEGQALLFVSPRNRVAQLYPRALGSLPADSHDSAGLRWRYCNPPPHVISVCMLIKCLNSCHVMNLLKGS